MRFCIPFYRRAARVNFIEGRIVCNILQKIFLCKFCRKAFPGISYPSILISIFIC